MLEVTDAPSFALSLALEQAQIACVGCSPNPAVGCVIVDPHGKEIGSGHTQVVGGPHAEIMALRDASARGNDVRGSTFFVTLEPCSHHGRTGPCCDVLIGAGIKRVVAFQTDPNPRVSGQGFARLRAAGVEVDVLPSTNPLAVQARELNLGFFSRMIRKRPWVRAKMAITLDGKTALSDGTSQWITSPEARADGHSWRARSCAVLTGIGTVLSDNPRLDVREVDTPRQPQLVIIDANLQTPLNAALFVSPRKVLIYTANPPPTAQYALESRGATIVPLPDPSMPKRVDLGAVMFDLGNREVNELHVECGRGLAGSLLQAGLVDDLLLYVAPKLLGSGKDMADLAEATTLSDALPLDYRSIDRIGPDLRIVARLRDRDHF